MVLPPPQPLDDFAGRMFMTTNLPILLHYEDRNSMAHSVEARVPFLDHRVVEFSVGLGDEHRMVGAETKRVLREAMPGILPEKVWRRRDKLGFATPEREPFRGALRQFVPRGGPAAIPGLLQSKRPARATWGYARGPARG